MSQDQVDIFKAATEPSKPARFALDPHAEFLDALKKLDRDSRRRFKASLLRERSQRASVMAAYVANVVGPMCGLFEHAADGETPSEIVPSKVRRHSEH